MAVTRSILAAAAVLALLSGCGGGDEAEPGGVTAEESAALNNAAEMLDASPDSLTAPEDMPIEEGGNDIEATNSL